MIKIKLEGVDTTLRRLANQQKQVAYASSRALNNVAFQTMRDGQAHIRQQLDKPTNWTVKSWYVRKKAVKTDLVASVGWSDYLANKRGNAADYYLSQQWSGGNRVHKAFESRLARSGILPSGMYVVPGKAAAELGMVNAYGNIKGSVYTQILSRLGTFNEAGYDANATTKGSRRRKSNAVYWAGKPGKNVPSGIWMLDEKFRNGRGRLRPILIFVDRVQYRAKLNLDAIAKKANANLKREFDKELDAALRAAR